MRVVQHFGWVFLVVFGLATNVNADTMTFGFINYTNNVPVDLGGQLKMVITGSGGSNLVDFKFLNEGPTPSVVTEILFGDSVNNFIGSLAVLSDSDGAGLGVDFKVSTPPLMGGFPFSTTEGAEATPPPAKRGVDPNEWVTLRATLNSGFDYFDIISEIGSGLGVGLHVQSINGGSSDKYVATAVPAPGAMCGLLGLGVIGLLRLRVRKK